VCSIFRFFAAPCACLKPCMLVYRKKTISAPNKIQSLSLTIGRSVQFSRCVFYIRTRIYTLSFCSFCRISAALAPDARVLGFQFRSQLRRVRQQQKSAAATAIALPLCALLLRVPYKKERKIRVFSYKSNYVFFVASRCRRALAFVVRHTTF